jgi:heme ABC exporter ATP-binding subunit CcmA
MHPSRTLVEAEGLGRAFGPFWALRDVDLRVEAGETVAVMGRNGAGKSTLLLLLATLLKPTTGRLRLFGWDVAKDALQVRRLIGVVSHTPYLYADLTAAENLRFYGRMYGVSDLEERVREGLARVGLARFAHFRVRALSRGMQQRLALARALLHGPRLLLLDEPDTGLDIEGTEMLRQLILETAAADGAVIFSTHNRERGLAWSDRALLLEDGRVVADGPGVTLLAAGAGPPTSMREAGP